MKYRPDPLALFYFKNIHEAETVFDDLIKVEDAVQKAKNISHRVKRLQTLQQTHIHAQVKEFIQRLQRIPADRQGKTVKNAIWRVFTSTHHCHSALIHRTLRARRQNGSNPGDAESAQPLQEEKQQ